MVGDFCQLAKAAAAKVAKNYDVMKYNEWENTCSYVSTKCEAVVFNKRSETLNA